MKTGRPKKVIDPESVKQLAAIACSLDEMAAVLSCDPKTLTSRFSREIREGRNSGNMSLRRKQFEVAMTGNVPMLIWLGKQRLGQADKFAVGEENDGFSFVADKDECQK